MNRLISTRKFRKTPRGVLTNIYHKMKERNTHRGFGEPPFTLKEFHSRYLQDDTYLWIFRKWELSSFSKIKKPSFDRTNPDKGYDFENMQVMTWRENRLKSDRENSIRRMKPVAMYSLEGDVIEKFRSIEEAVFETGISQSLISGCCVGKYNQTQGVSFKFTIHTHPELLEED